MIGKKILLAFGILLFSLILAGANAIITCDPVAGIPSNQITAGTNFCYYIYVSKGSNMEKGTNFKVDLDLLKGGKTPGAGNAATCTGSADCELGYHCDSGTCKQTLSELEVCYKAGFCVPISVNDVALVDVKAPSIHEGDPITAHLVVYNNNTEKVKFDVVYTFYDPNGNPIGSAITKHFDNVDVGQKTLDINPFSDAALVKPDRPDSSYKVYVELQNIQTTGGGAANSNTKNDSREAYFSVTKKTSALNIPETNLLLLPALFAVIAFIIFRK